MHAKKNTFSYYSVVYFRKLSIGCLQTLEFHWDCIRSSQIEFYNFRRSGEDYQAHESYAQEDHCCEEGGGQEGDEGSRKEAKKDLSLS